MILNKKTIPPELVANGVKKWCLLDYDEFVKSLQKGQSDEHLDFRPFHSNEITPGTPFFERCTAHLHHFIKRKLHTDPRWAHLNIIFSGPRTPGEGEVSLIDYVISV